MSKSETPDKIDPGSKLQARATIIAAVLTSAVAIILAIYSAYVTTNNSALTLQCNLLQEDNNKLREENNKLKSDIEELEKQLNELSADYYWKEYYVVKDEVIADQRTGFSLIVDFISTRLDYITVDINNNTSSDNDNYIYLGKQEPLDKEGEYSIILKSIEDSEHCCIVIKKN